jgi:hypothetical protein
LGDFLPLSKRQKIRASKAVKEFEVICLSATEGTKFIANKAVLRVLPFTSKWLNGKIYLVTQAYVSVETDLGTPQKSVGLVFDKENGREYALMIVDFNRFMETGDLSLLPKESTPPTKARTLQLRELCSRSDGWFLDDGSASSVSVTPKPLIC